MGFCFIHSPCFVCGVPMSYHPRKVPSIRDKQNVSQPVCGHCVGKANEQAKKLGQPLFEIPRGAYEPFPESEL